MNTTKVESCDAELCRYNQNFACTLEEVRIMPGGICEKYAGKSPTIEREEGATGPLSLAEMEELATMPLDIKDP